MTLRDLRKQAGLSVAEVAKALGVHPRTVGKYEEGVREICIRQVLTLSELYDYSAEDIISAQINSQCDQLNNQMSRQASCK